MADLHAPSPGSHILIVDDNDDVREALSLLLESWGHAVSAAANADECLALARLGLPDVVVLDLGLPGMDGTSLARELRRLEGGRQVCLIALTGRGTRAEGQGPRGPFDLYLVKPVDTEQFRALLDRVGRGQALRGESAA